MPKKQKGQEGVIFLKLFTKEILLSLIERDRVKQRIESEKVKMKIFKETPSLNSEQAFKAIISDQEPKRITMIHRENLPMVQQNYPIIEKKEEKHEEEKTITKEVDNQGMEKSMSHIKEQPKTIPREIKTTSQRMDIKRLLSMPMQQGNIPPMEKINPLLRDNTVVAIECPGPGKNIMIRKYNQVNMTKIILSEIEINSIIEHFSKEARIPLAGGILKAAVGNSIISAVVSEFVGSRFVINKITPYSLIGPK